ncbi:DsbA family protein [Rothia aeria]|uniref:DsbA family protein n=1 Tax=Rothia aeria TaxID=172042 RepID=UPI0028F01271|nr:DsbA family protein [Rothia aeria]
MTQSPMTRRTLFALGAPAALVTIAACSKSSSGTSNSTTSKSLSTPDRVVSFNWPEITETKLRDDTGYHLNKLVDGAPTVTLYTDYEVFECVKAELAYEKAAKDLEGAMNVTVRHDPSPNSVYARDSALAVLAAEVQGKHQAMARKLCETHEERYRRGSAVEDLRVKLKGYAKEIGLDVDKFDKTMDDKSIADLLYTDQKHAWDLRVKYTPGFTVNDKVLENIDINKVLKNVESSAPAEYLVKEFKKAAGLSWFVRFG